MVGRGWGAHGFRANPAASLHGSTDAVHPAAADDRGNRHQGKAVRVHEIVLVCAAALAAGSGAPTAGAAKPGWNAKHSPAVSSAPTGTWSAIAASATARRSCSSRGTRFPWTTGIRPCSTGSRAHIANDLSFTTRELHRAYLRRILARAHVVCVSAKVQRAQWPLSGLWMQGGAWEAQASLHTPTLITVGNGDPLNPPENGVRLAQHIPGAKLVRFPGLHLFWAEHPARFTSVLNAFIRNHP